MFSTESFIERLKQVDPKTKLHVGEPDKVVEIEIPFDDLRRFMAGETQFTPGCSKDWDKRSHASFVNFVDAPWPMQLDKYLRKELPMTLVTMKDKTAYKVLVYLPQEKKNGT